MSNSIESRVERLEYRLTQKGYGWILFLLVIAGVIAILRMTRLGAGLTDDSYFYILPARAFQDGQGFKTSPLFPPLLPFVLTGISILGLDAQAGVRYLNAALFGAAILLSAILIRRMTRSAGFSLLGALLVLTGESLLYVYSWAMSEPLYICLMLLTIGSVVAYLRDGKVKFFWSGVALAGLGAFTRYLGVCLVGAGVIVLLFWPGRTVSRRVRDGLVFGFLGLLPVAAYVLGNWLTSRTPFGARGFILAGYESGYTRGAINAILNWFLPGRLVNGREYAIAAVIAIAGLAVAAWYLASNRGVLKEKLRQWTVSPAWLMIAGFVALNSVILFSLLFTPGIIGKGDSYGVRYLSPIYIVVLIASVSLLALLWNLGNRLQRAGILLVCCFLVASYFYRAWDTMQYFALNGAGYAGSRWHISETVAYLNKHTDVPVVSTANYGLYFWTGKLPRSIDSFPNIKALHEYLASTGGYLVVIDSMPPEIYGLPRAQLIEGLSVHQEFSEGTIYQSLP